METSSYNYAVAGGKLITDLKVVELKAELEARGLNKYGNKRELLERLRAYLAAEGNQTTTPPSNSRSLEVPNPWLHQEANLENDFIREYLKSQQALFRQQIGGAPADLTPSSGPTAERLAAAPESPVSPALPLNPLLTHFGKKRGRKKKKKDKLSSKEQDVFSTKYSDSASPSPSLEQHQAQLRLKLKASACEAVEASSSSTWCGDDVAQRPSRSSARTSRALSRVSLEDEDSTPPLTASTSPSESPSHLMVRINRGVDQDDALQSPPSKHKKKHKKHSRSSDKMKDPDAKVPSLKIKFNESASGNTFLDGGADAKSRPSIKNLVLGNDDGSRTELSASEVSPFFVSACSASPQNSEVSSSIQDLGSGGEHLSPGTITSPRALELGDDSKLGSEKLSELETGQSQWRKSKRLIADLSEKATRRISSRGLNVAPVPVCRQEQQSPDTSERSSGSSISADDHSSAVQSFKLSGNKDVVPKRFDGLRVQLHRDSIPASCEGTVILEKKPGPSQDGRSEQRLNARGQDLRNAREEQDKRELELKQKRELASKENHERFSKEKLELELRKEQEKAAQEKLLCEKREQDLVEKRQREARESREIESKIKSEEEERRKNELRLKQEREMQAKRELEEKERQDKALREQREKKRKEELEKQLAEDARICQKTSPVESLSVVKSIKKPRISRAKKPAMTIAAESVSEQKLPQPPVLWQSPSPQVIEGNLKLQKEVRVPTSVDLIVSQVTCGLTEESAPLSLQTQLLQPLSTAVCEPTPHSPAIQRNPSRPVLPVITSPDHSSLVSLTPVPESSLHETPLLKIRTNLMASDLPCSLASEAAAAESHPVPSVTLPAEIKKSSNPCVPEEDLASFLTPSPVVSPRRSQECHRKSFGSPTAATSEDPRLATEVQDATDYLVKELQELDSSYGRRRRSLEEAPSPECTSTSVYTTSLTSPLQSPRLLSPERFMSPPPPAAPKLPIDVSSGTVNVTSTEASLSDATLVPQLPSVNLASNAIVASVPAVSSEKVSVKDKTANPSGRSTTPCLSLRPISSLLAPSSVLTPVELTVPVSGVTTSTATPFSQDKSYQKTADLPSHFIAVTATTTVSPQLVPAQISCSPSLPPAPSVARTVAAVESTSVVESKNLSSSASEDYKKTFKDTSFKFLNLENVPIAESMDTLKKSVEDSTATVGSRKNIVPLQADITSLGTNSTKIHPVLESRDEKPTVLSSNKKMNITLPSDDVNVTPFASVGNKSNDDKKAANLTLALHSKVEVAASCPTVSETLLPASVPATSEASVPEITVSAPINLSEDMISRKPADASRDHKNITASEPPSVSIIPSKKRSKSDVEPQSDDAINPTAFGKPTVITAMPSDTKTSDNSMQPTLSQPITAKSLVALTETKVIKEASRSEIYRIKLPENQDSKLSSGESADSKAKKSCVENVVQIARPISLSTKEEKQSSILDPPTVVAKQTSCKDESTQEKVVVSGLQVKNLHIQSTVPGASASSSVVQKMVTAFSVANLLQKSDRLPYTLGSSTQIAAVPAKSSISTIVSTSSASASSSRTWSSTSIVPEAKVVSGAKTHSDSKVSSAVLQSSACIEPISSSLAEKQSIASASPASSFSTSSTVTSVAAPVQSTPDETNSTQELPMPVCSKTMTEYNSSNSSQLSSTARFTAASLTTEIRDTEPDKKLINSQISVTKPITVPHTGTILPVASQLSDINAPQTQLKASSPTRVSLDEKTLHRASELDSDAPSDTKPSKSIPSCARPDDVTHTLLKPDEATSSHTQPLKTTPNVVQAKPATSQLVSPAASTTKTSPPATSATIKLKDVASIFTSGTISCEKIKEATAVVTQPKYSPLAKCDLTQESSEQSTLAVPRRVPDALLSLKLDNKEPATSQRSFISTPCTQSAPDMKNNFPSALSTSIAQPAGDKIRTEQTPTPMTSAKLSCIVTSPTSSSATCSATSSSPTAVQPFSVSDIPLPASVPSNIFAPVAVSSIPLPAISSIPLPTPPVKPALPTHPKMTSLEALKTAFSGALSGKTSCFISKKDEAAPALSNITPTKEPTTLKALVSTVSLSSLSLPESRDSVNNLVSTTKIDKSPSSASSSSPVSSSGDLKRARVPYSMVISKPASKLVFSSVTQSQKPVSSVQSRASSTTTIVASPACSPAACPRKSRWDIKGVKESLVPDVGSSTSKSMSTDDAHSVESLGSNQGFLGIKAAETERTDSRSTDMTRYVPALATVDSKTTSNYTKEFTSKEKPSVLCDEEKASEDEQRTEPQMKACSDENKIKSTHAIEEGTAEKASLSDTKPSSSITNAQSSSPPSSSIVSDGRDVPSSDEESALLENFINMGRTSRRRSSATSSNADSENVTTTTRRSSRHNKAALSQVSPSSEHSPSKKCEEVEPKVESLDACETVAPPADVEPVKNGDREVLDEKAPEAKVEKTSEANDADGEVSGTSEAPKPGRGSRAGSRSRSAEPGTPVRRSRRLSRGGSVEPSDDECHANNAVATAGELGTIPEQGESPEKKMSVASEPLAVRASPLTQNTEVEENTEIVEDQKPGETDLVPEQGDCSAKDGKEEDQITTVEESAVASDVEQHDDGVVDAVKLTLETSETLDKFDDSDEDEMALAAPAAAKKSPEKKRHSSRSPRKRRRSSSSSSSGSERHGSPRHQRRRESSKASRNNDSSPRKSSAGDNRSSSTAKSSHTEVDGSKRSLSPVKNGNVPRKSTSDSQSQSPGSAKKKHSTIVLEGLEVEGKKSRDERRSDGRQNKKDDKEASRRKEEEEEEPVDDFDYSSFKSTRRVSLSKKLRDPDNEKAKSLLTAAPIRSSEPTVELSSQSLKGLLPDVQPIPESELKLEEDKEEEDLEVPEDKRKSLGALSDSELKKRKLLLQKKLQGLEEKERQGKKRSSKDGERKSKASEVDGYEKSDAYSDPEEEEQALRKAAQESMRAKLAKKEELARRLSKDDETLEKKKIRKEREVREGSPPSKKSKDDRAVRMVEGPAVVVRKTPSIAPARNPTSCVVIIKNLTRPFTLRLLQTLLQRTGRIVQPDGFWVNNVKSVCIARFENEDQAEETRAHLHGIQWPSSNPKTLFVDFTTQEELERHLKESGAPVLPQPHEQLRRKTTTTMVREWDRVKLGERSPGEREREKELQKRRREAEEQDNELLKRERAEGRGRARSDEWEDGRHAHDRDRKIAKKESAPPPPPEKPVPKSLDDLFNKTQAKPSIYWLPLNKEQIAEKEALRRKLMAENEKQLAALKLKHEKEREEREKQRQEREKQREAEKKERAAAAAAAAKKKKKSRSRSRSRKRSPKRSSRSRRRSRS
ncbi:mucin-5AC [Hyalella azteca]|uniref:Mucin-5AC n=1 Tax=Hyalella azteca TaxID=294128 RepID=A0A8B7MYJ1_HYAAZ|nr:mucin-5AC [Hyalella azteca]